MILCTKCNIVKHEENFSKRKSKTNGRRSQCKSCDSICNKKQAKKRSKDRERVRMLKYKYNLTPEEYDLMLKKQKNKCAICKVDNPQSNVQYFHIDHCHKTGKIRGLLCHHCNTSLGGFRDSLRLLKNAVTYLRKNK